MWREPIFDRTNADTLTARSGQSNIDNHKGAINAEDLNRIEGNYQYLMAKLRSDAIFIPHRLRNFTETVLEYVEKENSALPEGYTQVEYIQSSGTQYIDTGFKPNQDTRVVMDCNVMGGSPPVIFGAMNSWVSNAFFYGTVTNMSSLSICYGSTSYSPTVSGAGRHIIDMNKNVLSLDSVVVLTCNETTFQSSYNMCLFEYNNGGTVSTKGTILSIYSCQIYDNGTLIRDYIPCINASRSAGLYDLVNSAFYANAGSGTFTVGAEIEPETTYELVETRTTYTDWQEQNIPWLSEIDRIRQNFNNLIALFLRTLDLPTFSSNIYLMYSEVNDWERVSLVGKTMFDNMEKEYVYSGTIDCGGDRLL